MNEPQDIARDYIRLGLALDRHVDGFADAYFGPEEFREEAQQGPPREPARLADDADRLLERVAADGLDPQRARWLTAQLSACRTVAGRLAGEAPTWEEEVERCFGIRPARVSEERFREAHALLDDALPPGGSLRDRYAAWIDAQLVPPERLVEAAQRVAALLRDATRELVDLPVEEGFDLELAEDVPWLAFNFYLGGFRSRVALNRGQPIWAPWLVDVVAHELYPGHHTERVVKERRLVRERGFLEETIVLALAPQALVMEGIAMLALETALGQEAHEPAAERLRPLGLGYDVEGAARVQRAEALLEEVGLNAARMLHQDGRPVEEVREYAATWSVKPAAVVDHIVEFVRDPTWRTYIATYSCGLTLCRRYVDGSRERFATLLSEQLTPAELQAD